MSTAIAYGTYVPYEVHQQSTNKLDYEQYELTIPYEGTCAWLGVELCIFDAYAEVQLAFDKLPEDFKQQLPTIDIYIVWSSS